MDEVAQQLRQRLPRAHDDIGLVEPETLLAEMVAAHHATEQREEREEHERDRLAAYLRPARTGARWRGCGYRPLNEGSHYRSTAATGAVEAFTRSGTTPSVA